MGDLLEQIKERVAQRDSPIRTVKGVAEAVGMSEAGFYMMLRKGTMKLRTKEAICSVLNVSQTYFDNSTVSDNKPDADFGDDVLAQIMQDMHEMKQMFEEQLRAKDSQIAGLQRTVDVLVGKYEGADLDQLLTATGDVDIDLPKYQLGTFMKTVLPIFLPQAVTK